MPYAGTYRASDTGRAYPREINIQHAHKCTYVHACIDRYIVHPGINTHVPRLHARKLASLRRLGASGNSKRGPLASAVNQGFRLVRARNDRSILVDPIRSMRPLFFYFFLPSPPHPASRMPLVHARDLWTCLGIFRNDVRVIWRRNRLDRSIDRSIDRTREIRRKI